MSFVHLHSHSYYSFLMGTPSPKDLVSRAKKLSFSSIAMTDSSNVCGIVEFVEAAEKEKIKAIIGAEVWILDGESDRTDEPAPGFQIVLLVENDEGWRNLCQILTIAHRNRNFAPRIRLEELSRHRIGLISLTGNQYGVFKSEEAASDRLSALVAAMGQDRVEVEVVDHGRELDENRNKLAIDLAKKLNLPVLVTNDTRYLEPEEVGVLEAMAKVGLGESPSISSFIETDQAWLKTEQEMAELFPSEWLERTQIIADRCSFSLPRGKPMLPRVDPSESIEQIILRFPPSKLLPVPDPNSDDYRNKAGSWRVIEGSSSKPVDRYFRWLCREGLRVRLEEEKEAERFGSKEEYEKQLEFECGVIEGMEYVVYHLMVSEFTNWAKDNGIAVGPGRGSAAGSIAVWSLRITDVNPKQFGLFFERFLNPERRGLPDIDMDFEKLRRDRVIAHVRERYGEECVAQILTIGKMKAKAALKDASRVCSVHFVESNHWSNFVDDGPKAKLKDSLGQGYLKSLREGSPMFKRVSDLALSLEGKPRQQGIHAAGVIIASDPVSRFCPMHYVPQDQIVCTGLDMDAAEKVGLVKFDFLGLKTLDVIQKCVKSIEEKTGKTPKIVDPLFDDPMVFDLMKRGETDGLFQIESPGMTKLIRKLVPENFEEVICLLALYRPGPLKSGMVSSWIERKHGREKVESVHPLLDEVLGPTYGLIVYQEQALSTARILAGFSLGQADLLRRAIGKKKPEEMKQQRESFVKGCWETNQIGEAEATRVFDLIDYFSGYSFNKSHSAAYAIVTYITAKLKAYFPAEFMAATMTMDMGDKDKIRQYTSAVRKSGSHVLRPDIQTSLVEFTAEDKNVRFGLGAIRGVGEAALVQICKHRPYRSIEDLMERAHISSSVAESLIWSGAMDSIEEDRFEAWWKIKRPKRKKLSKKVAPEQMLLFSGKTAGEDLDEQQKEADSEAMPPRPTEMEISLREANALGISLGVHPLHRFDDVKSKIQTHGILQLMEVGHEKTPFVLAARIEEVSIEEDKRGGTVAIMTVEDTQSSLRVILREAALRGIDKESLLKENECIVLHGTASSFEEDELSISIERVESLWDFRWRVNRGICIQLWPSDERNLDKICQAVLEGHERGTHDAYLEVCRGGSEEALWVKMKKKILPTRRMAEELERLTGRPDVVRMPSQTQEKSLVR